MMFDRLDPLRERGSGSGAGKGSDKNKIDSAQIHVLHGSQEWFNHGEGDVLASAGSKIIDALLIIHGPPLDGSSQPYIPGDIEPLEVS